MTSLGVNLCIMIGTLIAGFAFGCGSVIAYIRLAFGEYNVTIRDFDLVFTFAVGFNALFWTLRMKRCRSSKISKISTNSNSMITCYGTFLDYISLLHFVAVFGRLSYLSGSGSLARVAPLLELGLAIGLLFATRDTSLMVLRFWVTLYLPTCALVWILTYWNYCWGDLISGLGDDSTDIVLQFYPLMMLLLSMMHIWVAEVGFEFLLLEKKRQVREAQMKEKRERMNEKQWRLRNMKSCKKDDKKMIQTTIHWAEDKALGKSENESQVTKVA